jgi:hypothetical protein
MDSRIFNKILNIQANVILSVLNVLFVPRKMAWIHTETCREFCEAWCIVIWIVYELLLIIYLVYCL